MPINKAGRFTYQKQYSRWDSCRPSARSSAWPRRDIWPAGQDALSRLQSAYSNQITGSGNLTAKIALTRIQTATMLARQAAQGIDIST